MIKRFALYSLLLGGIVASAPARADPYICVGGMTDVEVLFLVKQDPYFRHQPADRNPLRIEYDGCGYRIHVGKGTSASREGDLLLVDRYGRVTKVLHQR